MWIVCRGVYWVAVVVRVVGVRWVVDVQTAGARRGLGRGGAVVEGPGGREGAVVLLHLSM